MIVQRVNAGRARAEAEGVKLGHGNKKDGERSEDERRWANEQGRIGKAHPEPSRGGRGHIENWQDVRCRHRATAAFVMEHQPPFEASVSA
jgi:hypothetical protein